MVASGGGGGGFEGGGGFGGGNTAYFNGPAGGNFNQLGGTYNPGWGYDPAQAAAAFGYQQGGGWPMAGANWSANGSGWPGSGTGQAADNGVGGAVV